MWYEKWQLWSDIYMVDSILQLTPLIASCAIIYKNKYFEKKYFVNYRKINTHIGAIYNK